MLIVELETGVWLASVPGDPGRTLVRANAKHFGSSAAADRAIASARKFHPFAHAQALPALPHSHTTENSC